MKRKHTRCVKKNEAYEKVRTITCGMRRDCIVLRLTLLLTSLYKVISAEKVGCH
jgi:hypothetical protein